MDVNRLVVAKNRKGGLNNTENEKVYAQDSKRKSTEGGGMSA